MVLVSFVSKYCSTSDARERIQVAAQKDAADAIKDTLERSRSRVVTLAPFFFSVSPVSCWRRKHQEKEREAQSHQRRQLLQREAIAIRIAFLLWCLRHRCIGERAPTPP